MFFKPLHKIQISGITEWAQGKGSHTSVNFFSNKKHPKKHTSASSAGLNELNVRSLNEILPKK